jgi:hypothetical protein
MAVSISATFMYAIIWPPRQKLSLLFLDVARHGCAYREAAGSRGSPVARAPALAFWRRVTRTGRPRAQTAGRDRARWRDLGAEAALWAGDGTAAEIDLVVLEEVSQLIQRVTTSWR